MVVKPFEFMQFSTPRPDYEKITAILQSAALQVFEHKMLTVQADVENAMQIIRQAIHARERATAQGMLMEAIARLNGANEVLTQTIRSTRPQ